MGERCALHPHFILDPSTGKARLFTRGAKVVTFLRKDEDGRSWIQDNFDSKQMKVRNVQLSKLNEGSAA